MTKSLLLLKQSLTIACCNLLIMRNPLPHPSSHFQITLTRHSSPAFNVVVALVLVHDIHQQNMDNAMHYSLVERYGHSIQSDAAIISKISTLHIQIFVRSITVVLPLWQWFVQYFCRSYVLTRPNSVVYILPHPSVHLIAHRCHMIIGHHAISTRHRLLRWSVIPYDAPF